MIEPLNKLKILVTSLAADREAKEFGTFRSA